MKTMNDEHDKIGAAVKRALETETGQLALAPDVRRNVIAAAEEEQTVGLRLWLLERRLALAGAACLLVVLGAFLRVALRRDPPHRPEPYMQIRADVRGGRLDGYWRKKSVEVRTRNGQEGFIKIEAKWPKQTSVIALNTRRER